MKRAPSAQRTAATLLELLVVIGIMLAIAALAAAILPALKQKDGPKKAAAQIQSSLSIAKQQAIRDGAPRGIRLIYETDSAGRPIAKGLQFIEVPEPTRFAPGYVQTNTGLMALQPKLTITPAMAPFPATLSATITETSQSWNDVNAVAGDYLIVNNAGQDFMFELTTINSSGPTNNLYNNSAVLTPRSGFMGLFNPSNQFTSFQIIRRARPLVGESSTQLPPNTRISFDNSLPLANDRPWCLLSGYESSIGTTYDILFNASGELMASTTSKIILWVETDNNAAGEPILVTVYSRTGAIILHTVDTTSGDFYSFTRDGQGSGL